MPQFKPMLALPVVVLFCIVFTLRNYSGTSQSLRPQNPPVILESSQELETSLWKYDYFRDGDNYTLSQEQCLSAFPRLYEEIDRSVAHWKARGGVTAQDIDLSVIEYGGIKARIYENRVGLASAWSGECADM